MDALVWILLPGFVAVGSGLLAWFIMQSRMDVAIARQREELAEARGMLEAQKQAMEDRLRSAEESARRKALDEFIADVRIEERHYVREHNVLFMKRKCLVLQERIYFRNIPLSNWIEHEMMVEEGADIDKVAKTLSAFGEEMPRLDGGNKIRKLLR